MMNWTKQLTTMLWLGVLMLAIAPLGAVNSTSAEDQPTKTATDQNDLAQQLIGTWKLVDPPLAGGAPGVVTRLKFFTGTHWCIIQPDPTTGVIVFCHGGTYRVDGDEVKTTRDIAAKSTESMIGGKKTLTIKIDGDTMTQTDHDGVYNETWKRVKLEPQE